MIEVICNDRLGKKVRVKCNEDDTIGDLKKVKPHERCGCPVLRCDPGAFLRRTSHQSGVVSFVAAADCSPSGHEAGQDPHSEMVMV